MEFYSRSVVSEFVVFYEAFLHGRFQWAYFFRSCYAIINYEWQRNIFNSMFRRYFIIATCSPLRKNMPRCKFYASGLCKRVMTTLENSYLSTESKYFSTINDFVNDMLVLHTRLMQLICAFLSAFMCQIYVTCSHAFFSFFFSHSAHSLRAQLCFQLWVIETVTWYTRS